MNRRFKYKFFAIALCLGSPAFASELVPAEGIYSNPDDVSAMQKIVAKVPLPLGEKEAFYNEEDPIAAYQTYLPSEGKKPKLSKVETALLIRYLENPSSKDMAQILAIYHLKFITKRPHSHKHALKYQVEQLKHAIYAQYFLARAEQLGVTAGWISRSVQLTEKVLANLLPSSGALDFTEGKPAHKAFFEAFNYTEANRYQAEQILLEDLLTNPTNLPTNLYSSAVNQWTGGEADYDDPAILYSFLKASYLGERSRALAYRAEQAWIDDPENAQLYRLAPTIAGFTIPPRRWLAKFHQDQQVVNLIDDELKIWLEKLPEFYSFPASVPTFSEPDNYLAGFAALMAGFTACGPQSTNLICIDSPRAPYNLISIFSLAADYALKLGDEATASSYLTFRYVPFFNFDKWYLGQEAWLHRETNFVQISNLYKNDDPTDDPSNIYMKKHKWGPETSTCQLCHQAQGAVFTEEEKDRIPHIDDADKFINDWPVSEVTWHAISKL